MYVYLIIQTGNKYAKVEESYQSCMYF